MHSLQNIYPSLIEFTILGKAIQQQKMKSQTMSGSLIAYKIVLAMNYEKAEFIAIEWEFI